MEDQVLKGSKHFVKWIIILSTMIIVPFLIGIGFIIANMIETIKSNDEILDDIIALISISLFVLIFIVADIVVLIQYKHNRIILTSSKLIETFKGNPKIEIYYSNIEKILMGSFITLIYCKDTFRKKGLNKGAKTFSCNLTIEDRNKLQKVIEEYNYRCQGNVVIQY